MQTSLAFAPMPRGIGAISKVDKFGWTIKNKPPEFQMVDKNILNVDKDEYQRVHRDARSTKIARSFDWISFGGLIVARRPDGSLWVIDGQHRLGGVMKRHDVDKVPCLIYDVNDMKEEASGFLGTNIERKAMSAVEKFKAQVSTGDKAALIVEQLMEDVNYQASNTSADGTVKCIAAMMSLAKSDAKTLRAIWPTVVAVNEGKAIHEKVMRAIAYIYVRSDGAIIQEPFKSRLIKIGRSALIDSIGKSAAFYSGGGGEKVWARGVVEILNKGYRTNRIEIPEL